MGVGDATRPCLEPLDGAPDRAVCRAPAEDQEVALAGP